jgi:molybdopterin biosynthesis enzyme
MASPVPALRPLAAVLADLASACGPLPAATVPIADALGGVLAEPLVIPGPVPVGGRALRAGFAVASRDLVGVSPYAPLALAAPPPWVAAGAPLPPGCDAVLPADGLARTGPLFEIVAAVGPGENARRAGEDGAAGETLAEAGTVLHPAAAAAALAAGIREAAVRRCDGRLVAAGAPATAALILSGIPGLRLAAEAVAGPDGWSRALASATGPVMLAVSDDGLASAAGELQLVAAGLALRPGETTQVFLRGARAVVVVPERLDVVFAVARLLLAPLAARLAGLRPDAPAMTGRLTRKLTSTVGFTELALLRARGGGLEPLGVGSFGLAALAQAQGWLAIPPESEGLGEGEAVAAHAL